MIAVIQRVSKASVSIDQEVKGSIGQGLMVLLGVHREDTAEDVEWLSSKMVNMRIFSDEEGKMNLALPDVGGSILLISQFTLHASTKKGNRPGYSEAARPETAVPLYEHMIKRLSEKTGTAIQTGEFGADMQVALINDGPVTIIVDTRNKQ